MCLCAKSNFLLILQFGHILFTIGVVTESAADLTLLLSHLRRALIGLLHSDHYYWVVSIFLIDCFLLVKVLLLQLTQKKWA